MTILKSKKNPFRVNKTKIIRRKINNENTKTFKHVLKNDNYLKMLSRKEKQKYEKNSSKKEI